MDAAFVHKNPPFIPMKGGGSANISLIDRRDERNSVASIYNKQQSFNVGLPSIIVLI
jgi:hypothetical protein